MAHFTDEERQLDLPGMPTDAEDEELRQMCPRMLTAAEKRRPVH